MQEKRNPFQIIILGVFIFFIIIAVLVFASFTGGNNNRDIGEVTVWGTFDEVVMEEYFRTLADENSEVNNVKYRKVPENEFQVDLVEALANGTGPDLFILDQSNLIRHWNKVQSISYETISERAFKDTYIDEAEIFLSASDGIKALPLLVDPLVLYWNRDIFAESGFSQPPQFWDELFLLTERITQRDKANNIEQATIAFGEFDNINNAKDIIATLILQAGGTLVTRQQGGQLTATLSPRNQGVDTIPAQTALRFYTEFADPVKSVYTWNRSLTNSLDAFAQGKLALYVGYASEVEAIQAKNANINFDVAPIPQIRSGEQKKILTFGKMYALAVPKAAQNVFGGTEMALYLTGAEPSRLLSESVGIPSSRRDVLSKEPSDPLDLIFRNAALISRAWLDPHAEDTNEIFRRMVGGVTSGSRRLSETIQRANDELNAVINR